MTLDSRFEAQDRLQEYQRQNKYWLLVLRMASVGAHGFRLGGFLVVVLTAAAVVMERHLFC